jgi:insecticidal toxin complex protein TccC
MPTILSALMATRCAGTPEIAVLGHHGQVLRQLRYNRYAPDEPLDEQVSRLVFNARGQAVSSVDARLWAQTEPPGGATPNFRYHTSLGGTPLRTRGVDAGEVHVLLDIEGQPVWQREARGTVQRLRYDLLGRPLERREQLDGKSAQVRERWVYGEAPEPTPGAAQRRNLRGQLRQHYDTAGLLDHARGHALQGALLQQARQLLADAVDGSDWPAADPGGWTALDSTVYRTTWQSDANGQPLLQVDAAGHRQRSVYDRAGRLAASGVRLKDSAQEQSILCAVSYSAAGQKRGEVAGNGVVTAYRYEPGTARLIGVKTTRAVTAGSARPAVLQDLGYRYDPVGTISWLKTCELKELSRQIRFLRTDRSDYSSRAER